MKGIVPFSTVYSFANLGARRGSEGKSRPYRKINREAQDGKIPRRRTTSRL